MVVQDITAGSGLGALDGEEDVAAGEHTMVQDAVDRLAAAGVAVHGESINATGHDIAALIVQRADELHADLIALVTRTTVSRQWPSR